jgi:MFS superfamily sulfate permease-like transporter
MKQLFILNNLSLFSTILLSGFYAGTGFFIIMGGNPAIIKMTSSTFAEYWQHTDYYMAARMKFFGPLLLITLLSTIIIYLAQWRTPAFWFLSVALAIMILDLIIVLTTNHPLNELIQSWDLNNLPGNVQEIKLRVVNAFWLRSACMIGSFACVVLAVFFQKNNY